MVQRVSGPASVSISARAADAIEMHARRAAPEECCGLLIGTANAIASAIPARNTADDPTRRYLIDPQDYFDSIRLARTESLEVVGAYHSHPQSEAKPSATDREGAFRDFLFVIVGLAAVPPDLTAWRLEGGNFVPVSLVRTP